jgi:hypothetical protein
MVPVDCRNPSGRRLNGWPLAAFLRRCSPHPHRLLCTELQPIPRTLPALHQAPQQPGGAYLRACLRSDQGRYFPPTTVQASVHRTHHTKKSDTPAIDVTSHSWTAQDSDGIKETAIPKRQNSIENTAADRSSGGMASKNTSTRVVVHPYAATLLGDSNQDLIAG